LLLISALLLSPLPLFFPYTTLFRSIDKLIRFSLITRKTDPIMWDFGSAAKHHDLLNPWLHETHMEADADPHAPHHNAVRPRAESDRKSTRLNSSQWPSRMPSSS